MARPATLLSLLTGVSAHAQAPEATVEVTTIPDCTVDYCGTDEGYAIQIIGYGDGDQRPSSPFDTAAARESDHRVDVSGEFLIRLPSGGMLWATEDPAVKDPRIALHAGDVVAVEGDRVVTPVEFFVYKNYDAFIERAVLEIYHDRDVDRLKPIASLALPDGDFVSVEWDGRSDVPLRVGDQLHYRVRAFDKGGRMDRTIEKSITAVSPADYARENEEPMPRKIAPGNGTAALGGPAAAALISSPLNGKVAVMKPPLDASSNEQLSYTLSPKFDTRKWALKADDRAELDRIISEWRDASNIRVLAVGHTDSIRIAPENRAEVANNQVLSENRARAVAEYVAAGLGVPVSEVTAIGRGKTEPVASNSTVAGRARNRRVELSISGNRYTRRSMQPVAVELVDPGTNTSVPLTGTLEEALNILTSQTGDTTPGASAMMLKDQGRRVEVDCSVAQTHRNELEKQNIPMYGSRVRLHGQDVDGNFALQVNDRMVPIDTEGKFAVDYMLPVGEHNLDVEFLDQSCVVRDQADVPVKVDGKHMFIVALADFTASDSSIGGSLEPLSVDDRYDEDFLLEGRMAFYLKGKVKGKYLVTAQLDTREEELSDILDNLDNKDPQQIFRRLDPDRYYPVYGDDSTTIADTDSIGRMYVRADWDSSHAVWGNFHTNYTGTEFAQYNRSLYGGRLDWHSTKANVNGDSNTTLNVFVSENQTELGHSEFIGTGGSLYYLRHTDVLPGSDKVRVEIRDRDSDRVLENITLTRGVDYEIDEIQGRLLLSRPLMQITRLRAPTLIRDRALDGNAAILIADYEYIPDGFSPDHVGYGGRASHWFGDHFQVGGTYVAENRGGGADDYTLGAVDVKLQAAPHTYIKLEFAQTEENQVTRFLSNDGGLRFDELGASTTAPGRDGSAYAVEARMNTREWLGTADEWVAAAWYRHSDDGFSIARRDNGVDVDEYGAEVVGQMGDRWTWTGRASVVERDTQRDDTRLSLQADYRLSDRAILSGELRHTDSNTTNISGGAVNLVNRTDIGDGTLAALRYTRVLNDRWQAYAGGQVSFTQGGGYDNNDMATVGVIAKVSDRMDFIAEYSDGHRGDGASVSLDYAINDRHRVYGTYTHSTDRTDTLANDQIAIGQRSRISNQLTVFNEHQFSNYREFQAGISHVFGLDFALEGGWNLGATVQTGELETGFGLVDRSAFSGSVGYQGDSFLFNTRIEYRDDDGTNIDADQVVSSTRLDYRYSPSVRFLGRLNLSETEDNADPNFDAKFTEGQIGMAYRPVHHNNFNMLAKYTFLYDLRGFDQDRTNTDQRSNIWSVEGLYQFNPRWGLGAKYAYRHGELRTDRNTGDWFESTTNFFAVRGRYHLLHEWDALAEYRWLDVDEAESTRSGFLIGVSKHLGEHFKLGIGYNFTDFSDDLTNLDYDHKGWFINALGKY
ncbi:MAG: OmpA family protein [Pseudomonadota bacterium]